MKDYKRILIMEVNWLGDVLFSTPFIRAVRKRFRDAHIACMVVPRCGEVLESNPRINELIVYDEKGVHKSLIGKAKLVIELRKRRFDCVIILHRSFTRALLAFLAGIPERIGYMTKKRAFLLTVPVEPQEVPIHKVEYFLTIARSMGCDVGNKNYEMFITQDDTRYVESELARCGIGRDDTICAIHPGGNWLPKRWSEKKFALMADSLIRKYGIKVVISGAETDMGIASRIRGLMEEKVCIMSGKTTLRQLGALMRKADFVVSGDSGPMHIAVAMRSRVIALFGPTSPALTGPYGSGHYRVIQKGSDCEIPCYDLTCSDYRCMDAITVRDVLEVFDRMYQVYSDEKTKAGHQ